jgi:hypothetical protein
LELIARSSFNREPGCVKWCNPYVTPAPASISGTLAGAAAFIRKALTGYFFFCPAAFALSLNGSCTGL